MIDCLAQVAAKKISMYLEERITQEKFRCFSFVLEANVTPEDIAQAEERFNDSSFSQIPVLNMTKENAVARTCLELAFFAYACPYAEELFGYMIPGHGKDVSLRLAAMAAGQELSAGTGCIADAYFLIEKILLSKTVQSDLMDIPFFADFTLASLLEGQYMPSADLGAYVTFNPKESSKKEMILWEDEAQRMSVSLSAFPSSVLVVYGERSSGRRFFASCTAGKCGLGSYLVEYDYLSGIEISEQILRIKHVVRDCFLLGCALCVCNITESGPGGHWETIQKINRILSEFSFSGLPVFLTAETSLSLIPYLTNVCFTFTIPRLNAAQSGKVWDHFSSRLAPIPAESYRDAANRICLPAGKIRQAVLRCGAEPDIAESGRLAKICYEFLDSDKYKGIQRLFPKYRWDDLKLADRQKNMLQQICDHVIYRDKVMDDWNMRRFFAYGSCISALFTGAPGTGKTMAAHVIADRLKLALYQVDLSQVLDKYIGETEKHLSEIFDIAQKGNVILFLDEADALLGKRSEIQSAHDRYGNHEMAYILQRIEAFDGILLMATNLGNNIDPAFLRRIRYIVNFTMPDRGLREQLWRSFFEETFPHDEIDFAFLSSDDFAFSGASIKNIMMTALIRAGASGKPLNMQHIVSSMKEEYRKMGMAVAPDKWKPYEA